LTQQLNAFRLAALNKLREIRAATVEYRPEFTLIPIEALAVDPIVKDLVGDATPEEILLLRHAHSPKLLFALQDAIRIAVGNMPIAVQIPFIRYLSTQSASDLERIGAIFKKVDANHSDALLTSFLACREDLENGEMILRIADHLPSKQGHDVFTRYAHLVNEARNARSVL
jgi:hypothetical protein